MDITDALDRAFEHAHGVIANVRPDQYDSPTPCAEWNVRQLLEHMTGVVAGLGSAAAGREANGAFELGADPAAQFQQAAAAASAAWRTPGVLDKVVDAGPGPMPGRVVAGLNLLDTATHTWDRARATGQSTTLPRDVADAAMDASRMIISPEIRPGRFDSEVDIATNADPTERLVAFLGRRP